MSLPLDFSFDVNDVDNSRPILLEGSYILNIADIVIEENKEKTGHNLKVTLATTAPATSVEGREKGNEENIKPGFKLTRWFPLQAKPGSDHDFRKGLVELMDAALKTEQGTRPPITPELLMSCKGKEVIASVKVRTETQGQYAGNISNDVARLRPLDS